MTYFRNSQAQVSLKQKKKSNETEIPIALRAALKPPEKMTVSEWADRFRVLNGNSAVPGPWRTSFVPYTKAPMDAFTNPEIDHIILLFGTQGAKTEIINNMIGYAADQDPGPTMLVYAEEGTAKFASLERLQPMFEACSNINAKFRKRESERLELRFDDMFLVLVGANSASKLASRPIRYLFRDEIAKYKKWTGDEASPMKLSEERTKTFSHNRKIVDASTVKLKGDNIDKAFWQAKVRFYYYVPCPHCGRMQRLKFGNRNDPGGIKWPKDINDDPELALDTAWYECEHCRGVIEDKHKTEMLLKGEWRPDKKHVGRLRSVAYHVNSIYSPFLKFGDVAKEFLSSKDEPADLMNFINSWLAEPWEDKAASMESDIVLSKQTELPEMVIPDWAQLFTAGVDVQQNRMYFTIRAWSGTKLTSQKITSGIVQTWDELDLIMNNFYPDTNGELKHQVHLCAIDSGFDTEAVYEFCLEHQDYAVPVKGSSTPMASKFKISPIEAPGKRYHGQSLYIVNTDQYKNSIAARLNRPLGTGCFMVHAGCDDDYAKQLTSEHKIREPKGGHDVETWVKKTSSSANHYLDCEVYAYLAADLKQVRYLAELEPEESSPVSTISKPNEDNWIPEKEGWLDDVG